MKKNTEHRVVVHRDGDVPTRNDYCVILVDSEPKIAFYDKDLWVPTNGGTLGGKVSAWFYIEDILMNYINNDIKSHDIRDYVDAGEGRI